MREPYEILYPAGGGPLRGVPESRGLRSAVLRPASRLYGLAAGALRQRRMRRRVPLGVSARVVSIGNLEVGGNGKTPLAIHLLTALSARGRRPVYVSRGFGGEAERLPAVTILAPLGVEPGGFPAASLRLVSPDARALSRALGDEGALVNARCPNVPLAFSRRRRAAIETVCAMFDPSHVVLDDAFQTWGLPRDADIVLLDAKAPLGNGRLLPAGTLREGAEALARADAIGFNGLGRAEDLEALRVWAGEFAGVDAPVFGVCRRIAVAGISGDADGGWKRAASASLCGIGRPERFERALIELGVDLRVSLRYPDHYRYRGEDVRRVADILDRRRIERLIMTEKDWMKIREAGPPDSRSAVARLDLEIVGEDPVVLCEEPRA